MSNQENEKDFLNSEPEEINVPPEAELGANENIKVKPKVTLNKKPIAQAVGLISVAAIVFGGLAYIKLSDKEEKPEDLGVVSNPVSNPNSTDSSVNKLSFNPPQEAIAVQQAEQPVPPPPMPQQPQVDEAAEARKTQERAMLEARYKSSVMVTGGSGDMSPNAAQANGQTDMQAFFAAMAQGGGQNGAALQTQSQSQSAASTQGGRFNSGTSQAPVSSASYNPNREFLVQQGKVIDAVLETAVKSDIPSTIIARVSDPVYGEQGRYELLPAGTRLFGEYSSVVKAGQTEIAAIWRRAITPQGVEIMLDSPSTNNLGIVGMGGKVNNHFFRMFGTAALLSVFGAATATVDVKGSDNNNSAAQYRSEVANAFNDTAQNMLSKHADIPPTIEVKHGAQIKILVAKDLDFSSLLN